jgi:hypothetical protein
MAGMGVDAGDVDGSGRPSLFVTNFQGEPSVLFLNRGRLLFDESSDASGVAAVSHNRLGFGSLFFDPDLDGHLDVAVAYGHVQRDAERLFKSPFAQEAQILLGDGKAKFRDVSKTAGPFFRTRVVGRGLACADYNNDGRPDLIYTTNGGPAFLLKNATQTDNNWIRLELIGDGKKSNRNAIGARVEVEAGGRKQVLFVNGGGSYLSASERRLLVGLGQAKQVERVTVHWPSRSVQVFDRLESRQWWRLHEGKPQPERITLLSGSS